MTIDPDLDAFILRALDEDLGSGDITSAATIPSDAMSESTIVARRAGCVAGLEAALRVFHLVDGNIDSRLLVQDGTMVGPGAALAKVAGPTRAILAAERVAMNLLGHLSGVATATQQLVDRVAGTRATIVDTRKTTPGMRFLEKAAVRTGGGENHRFGLYDAVLIKDNHLAVVGSAAEAVSLARARVGNTVKVEVEIEDLADLEPSIEAGADAVMLDNMSVEEIRRAVEIAGGRCLLEASGGITRDTVLAVAETGVDWISVGRITHSAPSLDVALDFADPSVGVGFTCPGDL